MTVHQGITFDPSGGEYPANPLEVRCPKCGVRTRNACVSMASIKEEMEYDAEHRGTPIGTFHRERWERARLFRARGKRWACERCGGSRPVIEVNEDVDEMISSSEGTCSTCGLWVSEPAGIITADETLESMDADLAETHELVPNPDAPGKAEIGMEERAPMLVGEPHHKDAQFHLVPRTKPFEVNPAHRRKMKELEATGRYKPKKPLRERP